MTGTSLVVSALLPHFSFSPSLHPSPTSQAFSSHPFGSADNLLDREEKFSILGKILDPSLNSPLDPRVDPPLAPRLDPPLYPHEDLLPLDPPVSPLLNPPLDPHLNPLTLD